jgi:hypothetical protein
MGIRANEAHVQGQFDIVARPIAKPDPSMYDELPMTEHPMNSFANVSDEKRGLAF